MRASLLGFLPGSLLSEDAEETKRKQKYIYILNNNIQIWWKVFQLCQCWSVQTQLKVSDKVTKTPQFKKAQYHPSKPNQPNPSTNTGGEVSLWKMTGTALQTLPLALMFLSLSQALCLFVLLFHTRVPLEMLGFQTQSQLSKTHCILKSPFLFHREIKELAS